MKSLATRPVAGSVDELLAGAEHREPMVAADSKSGARFEPVVLGGQSLILKHLHVDDDWIMRSTGDLTGRAIEVWRAGILDALPECIDHAVVGAASGLGRNGWGGALLMRDVASHLVPEGDEPVSLAQHLGFLDHMAALHGAFLGWSDTVGLTPATHRYLEFSPHCVRFEAATGWPDAVPRIIMDGWDRFAPLAGELAGPVADLLVDPEPLVDALGTCPQTLLHGDWKMGNLGTLPSEQTILLDWAVPGQGCPPLDLAWYLSLNAARIPQPKQDAIDAYGASLERHGVRTDGWFERAMDLALLGAVVWFGWEKALGGPGPELEWWLERGADGIQQLG